MIISASRRTDIPAFYFDWFLGRLGDGYALTRNPMNAAQVRRVSLAPDDVSGIVFWSKNPAPMLPHLDALGAFPFYVQYTLNAYGADIEPGLPPLAERIATLRRLAERIGPERVIWRYDPILLSPEYPEAFHEEAFSRLASALSGASHRVTISFIDFYAKIERRLAERGIVGVPAPARVAFAGRLQAVAARSGFVMDACAEDIDLTAAGVGRARCVDAALLANISGRPVPARKDPNQRPACGCAASVDIGAYDTCPHGCAYCYANRGAVPVSARLARHDPRAPFLMP